MITCIIIFTFVFSSFGVVKFIVPLNATIISESFDITYYTSPGFSPTGLTWQGGNSAFLWNADSEAQKIYKLVPSDGNVLDKFESPGEYPSGLTWDGQFLWNVDSEENRIYKINPTNGTTLFSFQTPGVNPMGLTWDGEYLWNVDSEENKIYKLNPDNGIILNSFKSPGSHPSGLTFDGQYLWNADYEDKILYMLQPDDGSIIYKMNVDWNHGPWGLAWHDEFLWNADNENFRIFKIKTNLSNNQPPFANFTWVPQNPEPDEWIYFNHSSSYDSDGNITHYLWDFDNDGTYDVIDDVNPYPKQWENPGSYMVTLTIMDDGSPCFNDSITKMIKIREKHPPTVNIIHPKDGDIVNGSVQIQGSANDLDATISKVEIRINEGPWQSTIGTTEWSHWWHTNLLNISDGSYQIAARSYNGVSYSNISEITVILDNHKPELIVKEIGGFQTLSVTLKNKGDVDAENIECSIDVFGGYFGLVHAQAQKTIPLIEVGGIYEVSMDKPIFGLGPLDVTLLIQADNIRESVINKNAFIFGFLIF